MNTNTDNTLLGYSWGYKQVTSSDQNQFYVNFVQGVSSTYPQEHQHKKDFHCEQITQGQYSSLYLDKTEIIKQFQQNIQLYQDSYEDCTDQNSLLCQQYREMLMYIDHEDIKKYFAVSQVLLNISLGRYKNSLESVLDILEVDSDKLDIYTCILERYYRKHIDEVFNDD